MIPALIMLAASMAKNKANIENQQVENMSNGAQLQQQQPIQQPNMQDDDEKNKLGISNVFHS